MMKAKLAIDIGFDKIRACVCIGRDIHKIPLGSISSPYAFPPIGVKTQQGYKFGEVAKLCAVTSPDSTVFLYDYLRQNAIPQETMISLLNVIKERTMQLYNIDIDSIALVTPPYFKDLIQSKFLDDCIRSVSNKLEICDTTISFSRSFLNINVGQFVMFLDFRDYPAYISIIKRGANSYESIGASTIEDFSLISCENFIEDTILSNYKKELFSDGEIITAWIQGEIASKVSQDAILQLMLGKSVRYEIPFTVDDIIILQSEFQNWLLPKLDQVCVSILDFTKTQGMTFIDISQIALLGGIFESQLVRERVEKFLKGYNQEIRYSYFPTSLDEWKNA